MYFVVKSRANTSLLRRLPVPGFSDNFDRPVGTSLGLTSGESKPWMYDTDGATALWRTSSGGTAVCVSGSGLNIAYVDAAATNGVFAITMASLGSSRRGGPVFRYRDINNHLFIWQPSPTEGPALYKRVNGVSTRLGDTTYIPADGDIYEVELNNANIIVKIGGVVRITAVETAFQGDTRHGMVTSSSSFQMGFDNVRFTPAA